MTLAFRFSMMVLILLFLVPKISLADVDSGMESGASGDPAKKTSYGAEKKYNFSFEPVAILVGYFDIAADFKMSETWTLGPVLTYWHTSVGSGDPTYTDNISLSEFSIGARGNWYLNGVFSDGLYISPILQLVMVKATTVSNGQNLSASLTGVSLTGLVGYQWFWNSFNMKLGGGLSLSTTPSKIHIQSNNSAYSNDVSYDPTSLGFVVDFMIGWAF